MPKRNVATRLARRAPAMTARLAAYAVCVLLLGACDRDLVAPKLDPNALQPSFSSSASITPIPIPETNTHGSGTVWWFPVEAIEPKRWVRLRVQGKVEVDYNPVFVACDTAYVTKAKYAPGAAGPMGLPGFTGILKVNLRRRTAVSTTGITLNIAGDSALAGTTHYSGNGYTLDVERKGLDGGRTCNGVGTGFYALSGSQHVSVERIPDPKAYALRTVIPSTAPVRFVAQRPAALSGHSLYWYFLAGDTLAQPARTLSSNYITACQNKVVCDFWVSKSGRMYLMVGGTQGEIYPTQTVWVGKNPATTLTLECTLTSVPIGSSTTCTAGTAPAGGTLEIQQWFYVVDDPATSDGKVLDVCDPTNPCTFAPPADGRIVVHARVDGIVQTADVEISIGILADYCPPGDAFASDSTVIEGLRELWYFSYPDSLPVMMRERMGFVIENGGQYVFDWVPRDADACEIRDPMNPNNVPLGTVAWVHTHPLPYRTPFAQAQCMTQRVGLAGRGASSGDRRYRELVSAALGREIPGYILEHGGLTRFDSVPGSGTRYPNCDAWKRGKPIWNPFP